MINGTRLKCGCVIGAYWCGKHDIYVKQDRKKDPRWTTPESIIDYTPPEGCSCHINPPCSYCMGLKENE